MPQMDNVASFRYTLEKERLAMHVIKDLSQNVNEGVLLVFDFIRTDGVLI